MANALQQKYGVQPADSQTIAHLANGNFIKALETIHLNEENELIFQSVRQPDAPLLSTENTGNEQWSEQLAAMGANAKRIFWNTASA